VLSTAAPRYGDDGAFLGYVGSVIDVDERRRAEEALRQSEGRLRRAQEAGGIGDWELDLATEAVYWSESLFDLTYPCSCEMVEASRRHGHVDTARS
jgi:PAS domain-containing protein